MFGGVTVSGDSMNLTLSDQEQLLMKYVRDGKGLDYGDVIVVHVEDYPEFSIPNQNLSEAHKTKYLIKRLIAKEGDRVRCEDGHVEILYKGEKKWVELDEPYAYYMDREIYDFAEYYVGEGQIFFLGRISFILPYSGIHIAGGFVILPVGVEYLIFHH